MQNINKEEIRQYNRTAAFGFITGLLILIMCVFVVYPTASNYQKKLVDNQSEGLLTVLGILLSFFSLVGVGIYFVIKRLHDDELKRIKIKIDASSKEERLASKIEVNIAAAYVLFHVYSNLDSLPCGNNSNISKNNDGGGDHCLAGYNELYSILRACFVEIRKAVEKSQELRNEKNEYLRLRSKNNLSFYLVNDINLTEEGMREALNYSAEIFKTIADQPNHKPVYIYKATRAMVLRRAGEIRHAEAILQELLDDPLVGEDRVIIKNNWRRVGCLNIIPL